jgi:hypothetical protein
MDKGVSMRSEIAERAVEIDRLHRRIHEEFAQQPRTDEKREERIRACREFHERYGHLCFPGGWREGFINLAQAGDSHAVEVALCFLEARPYYFRSGYMWNELLKKSKRFPMSDEQSSRLQGLLKRYEEWKAERGEKSKRGMKVRYTLSQLFLRFERLFPVFIPDSDLDGIDTVGKLYIALCDKLGLEPLKQTSGCRGQARKPYSPERSLMFVRLKLSSSEAHCRSSWNAADVWATLAAAIRLAYVLDEGCPIYFDTELPIRLEK